MNVVDQSPAAKLRKVPLAILAGALVLASVAGASEKPPRAPAGNATVPVDQMVFETPPPPFEDPDIFPCSECHNEDQPADPKG